jgi:signal peptidase I
MRRAAAAAALACLLGLGLLAGSLTGGGATVAGFSVQQIDGRNLIGLIEPSVSMDPTIRSGQIVAVDVDAYLDHGPERGDIVAFTLTGECPVLVFKRVAGLPGDTVQERDGRILVNGEPLAGPRNERETQGSMGPWVVEAGRLFVVGDNLENSNDSRFDRGIGQVAVTRVVGEVDLTIELDRADAPAPVACSVSVPTG